jgi:CubicO group peptidase (beta-lactamase class C family)
MRTLLTALALTACTPATSPGDSAEDRGDDSGDTSAADAVDWTALQQVIDDAYAEQDMGLEGMKLLVWDADDALVFEHTAGWYTNQQRVAVASASKLVAALTIFTLIDSGDLALTDTTAGVLGWEGEHGAITLDQLGAFTSGLAPSPLCTYRPAITTADCLAEIEASTLSATPGTRYDYGPSHFAVAAGMATARTGLGWNDLFQQRLAGPLGLTSDDLKFYTMPQHTSGTSNPLVAGGLTANIDEYSQFLRVVFHRGEVDSTRLFDAALTDRLFENHYTDATIGTSPMDTYGYPYHYSFGSWLECDGAVSECDRMSSPGAYGFTPWVDREHGYYAILAMEDDETGAAGFSVGVAQALQPLIEERLAQ